MQKPHLHKTRLGFRTIECSTQNDKDKGKEVKVEEEKKPEDARKTQNKRYTSMKILVYQSNSQRYPTFNGYCFQWS